MNRRVAEPEEITQNFKLGRHQESRLLDAVFHAGYSCEASEELRLLSSPQDIHSFGQ